MKKVFIIILSVFSFVSVFAQSKIPMLAQNDPRLTLYAGSENQDVVAIQHDTEQKAYIVSLVDFGLVGALAGVVVGEIIPLWQVTTTKVSPASSTTAWVDTGPTSGQWVTTTIPASSSTSTSANSLVVACGAVIGAGIAIGVYELGHRILRWW
jgi:hypothetical protein